MDITGKKLFVKALLEEGVDTVFAYPGGMVTDILDELYRTESIDMILPRHEQGLIHAADGYARSTGKVGVCLATSGPGATNLVTGIATANYDSVPLVCFTGQVATNLIGNDTFQEVDIVGVTRNIAKFVIVVRRREDLNRLIKEAFYIASTGKPGPVLLDLPKDVMAELGMKEGFDVGLEMSGSPIALSSMIDVMCHGGKIALLGILPNRTQVDWDKIIFNGLTLKGIYGREMFETWYKMSSMLESGLDISPVITHRFHYTDFEKGFEAMRSGKSGKVILNWEE